jgi:hypothetical protein
MTPILLLDFDGVLNALRSSQGDHNSDWTDWELNTVDGFTTLTSRSMAAATAKIAETNWLTTWNENDSANILLSPLLSIGPFPVAAAPPVNYDPLWKPRAVAGQLSTGRPVVWFDDEAEDLWAHWGKEKPNNLFLLAPDESRGLTRLELEAAADWLKKRSSSLP